MAIAHLEGRTEALTSELEGCSGTSLEVGEGDASALSSSCAPYVINKLIFLLRYYIIVVA